MSKAWHCHMPGVPRSSSNFVFWSRIQQPSKYRHHNVKWPTGARSTPRLSMSAIDANLLTNHVSMPVRFRLQLLSSHPDLITNNTQTLVSLTVRASVQLL